MSHFLVEEEVVLQIGWKLRHRRHGCDQPAIANAALQGICRLHIGEQNGRRMQRETPKPADPAQLFGASDT